MYRPKWDPDGYGQRTPDHILAQEMDKAARKDENGNYHLPPRRDDEDPRLERIRERAE